MDQQAGNGRMDGLKILRGLEEISRFTRVDTRTLKRWIKYGLPCTPIDGIYYAHADNIDAWVRQITRSGPRKVEEGVE